MPKHTHPIKHGREIAEALAVVGEQGGVVQLPAGTYDLDGFLDWPNLPNVTLRGEGADATILEGGIRFPGGVRIPRWRIEDLSIHGQGEGIGLHVIDGDRGELRNVRCTVWETCVKISSTLSLGALHNDILRCTLTNAEQVCLHLTDQQGPHQTHIHGGEISKSKGVGLQVDAPTDNTEVLGVSFEAHAQAMLISGVRGHYLGFRLEGNERDVLLTEESGYNILQTGFFDPDKHEDRSTSYSNRVLPYGLWTSATERKAMHYVPADPMALPLKPLTPGARSAVSHLFQIYEMFRLESLSFVPAVQAGNVDLAVCSTDGTVIASTGPVPVGPIDQWQEVRLPKVRNLVASRQYYVVIASDNDDFAFHGVESTLPGFQLGQGHVLARQKQLTDWPIGVQDCVSGGSGTRLTPAISVG